MRLNMASRLNWAMGSGTRKQGKKRSQRGEKAKRTNREEKTND